MRPLVHGYDELRIRIDRREPGAYHVLASTQSAEASVAFEPPFNDLEIENFILKVCRPRGRRRIATSAIGDARRFGGGLFHAVFRDAVLGLYRDALAHARALDRGVRITMCLSEAPELIDVPWEYLFDDPDFLAVSAYTPVVRYLDLPRAHRPLLVEPPLRLLGVVSSPAEYERLDVERERDNLERALSGLRDVGAVELHWLERPTPAGLLKALQAESFHALHYVGHGSFDRDAEHGVLLFEDDGGWAHPVSGDKLGMILHDFSSLRLAVLNACEGARTGKTDPFSGVAGSLVQRDIPAVVAMQFEISDEAAIVFASGFYEPLAAGSPVDASLAAARLAMLAERNDDIEWGTPVLFMRVPDGRIFDLGDHRVPAAHGAGDDGAVAPGRRRRHPSTRELSIRVNYRHEDTSGHALLLADRLRNHFGDESVQLTTDQGPELDALAERSVPGVLLALIGPAWASSLKRGGAARPGQDATRRELESALTESPESVIPVLIDAVMPDPQTLPRSLRGVCRRESVTLHHASFDHDLASLIERLEQSPAARSRHPAPTADAAGDPVRLETIAHVRTSHRRPAVPSTLREAPGAPARPVAQVAGGIPVPYDNHFAEVVSGMLDGSVVPLLGVGVRAGSPSADQLAFRLAERFDTTSSGLAEVAQRVAMTLGEKRLYSAIRDLVEAQSEPADVHRFLAEFPGIVRRLGLPPRHQLIISANYDLGLERAFEDAHEPFDYAVYLADSGCFVHVPWGEEASESVATTIIEPRLYVDFPIDDDGELERTIIVKIHGGSDAGEGGITWRNNYVVTEDHYIDYLPTQNIQDHVPIQILDKLTSSRCLFLGYGLRHWNARVFLRRIWRGKPITESSWAIAHEPDPLEKASWSVVGHVELLDAALPDYVDDLRTTLLGRGGAD